MGKKFVKRAWLAGVALLAGCTILPMLSPPAADMQIVIGGISNTRPYFGRVRLSDSLEGDFLLASCGCGDWRVLVAPDDGSDRTQFAVHFYSTGEYQPTGEVTVYGEEESGGLSGTVNQDTGEVGGDLIAHSSFMDFLAYRGEEHTDSAEACALCHTGPDPIWPQPEGHPAFSLDPPNCLSCHSVNGQ